MPFVNIRESLRMRSQYSSSHPHPHLLQVSFNTLQEASLKTTLSPAQKAAAVGYDAELFLSWPSGGGIEEEAIQVRAVRGTG